MTQSLKGSNELLVAFPEVGDTFTAEDGTVSVVLADTLDPNYEPSQEEIEVFAEWMGMKLPEDNEFLYIAREGLKAPLPKDWRPCRTNEDEIYYFNFRTGESTWNHPMDEFFRRKFISEKEKKKKDISALCDVAKRDTVAASSYVSSTDSTNGGTGGVKCGVACNNGGNQSDTACIMKKPLVNVVGGAAGEKAFVPTLGAARSVLGNASSSLNDKAAVDVLKQAPAKKTTLQQSTGEPRFVSEAEKNLEDKIRQEKGAAFKIEEESAEKAHEATLQEMRRTNELEVQKLQEEIAARLAAVRSRGRKEQDYCAAKQRRELEDVMRARIEEVLKEERSLQQQLAELKEQHVRRIASEVTRVESVTREQHERELKRRGMEMTASLEKLKSEAAAEFILKKAELQKKFQEDEQQVRESEQRRHQAEMAALQQKEQLDRMSRDGGSDGMAGRGDVDNIAAIFAREKEREEKEMAAIMCAYKEEQAALRKNMEEVLSQLHEEISDIERESDSLPATLDDKSLEKSLAEVRCRWQAEEKKHLDALAEERQRMLATLERQLQSASQSPSFCFSSFVTCASNGNCCEGPRVASSATLEVKKKAMQETEALLRAMLQKELACVSAPADVQITQALKNDFSVFVRSMELQRQFGEGEEFECGRGKQLSEDKRPEELIKLTADAEKEIQDAVAEEVEKVLSAMTTENEVARKSLQERHQNERRLLFANVDKEVLAYEQNERCIIDAQEEAKAKQREMEPRAVVMTETMADMEDAKNKKAEGEWNVKDNVQTQHAQGVPIELLQQRLNSIELMYMSQEQELKAELEGIHMEIRRLKQPPTLQEEKPLPQGFSQLFSQPRNIAGAVSVVLPVTRDLPCQNEKRRASSFSLEALHFLGEQKRELGVRRGMLNAAREEWQNDVRSTNSHILSAPLSLKIPSSTSGAGDAGSQLLTLVSLLGDRLEDLSGRFAELQATTASLSSERLVRRRRSCSGRHHCRNREAYGVAGGKTTGGKSLGNASHKISKEQKLFAGCMEKWSKIFLELSSSCP